MVQPFGVVTLSIAASGCIPFWMISSAAPLTVWLTIVLAVLASNPIWMPPWVMALIKRSTNAIPQALNTVAPSIRCSSSEMVMPTLLKRALTLSAVSWDALTPQMQVTDSLISAAILGIALNSAVAGSK